MNMALIKLNEKITSEKLMIPCACTKSCLNYTFFPYLEINFRN